MDLLANYNSDSDEKVSPASQPSAVPDQPIPTPRVNKVSGGPIDEPAPKKFLTSLNNVYQLQPAPEVSIEEESIYSCAIQPDETSARKIGGKPVGEVMKVNIPYDQMALMVKEDPLTNAHPQSLILSHGVYAKYYLGKLGHLDQQAFSDYDFRTQENTFKSYGYAVDPSLTSYAQDGSLGSGVAGTGFVGDFEKALAYEGVNISHKLPKSIRDSLPKGPKRKPKGDVTILEGEGAYAGPWAGYEGEIVGEPTGPPTEDTVVEPTEHAEAEVVAAEPTVPQKKSREVIEGNETTIFHGDSERDYLGRTYMHVPQDLDIDLQTEPGSQQCFLPKKHIHTWTGHTKAVSAIRFFPNSGHLLLSAGMDNKIKLWDAYHDRRCLRTILGHNKAVRDINFNNDGSRFISVSYDRTMKIWDTETGKCIRSFSTGKIPYCAKFHPDKDKQHLFLAGCSDKKIVQFDTRSGDICQEYDQHLGPVNSITFVDNNRRFVSTSDDKTMRVWEFDIPVVIKYVAEPYMHSMPSVSVHPSKKWIACQSLDNQILIYGAKGRFSLNSKKRFSGHIVAGYACQPNFSPDGRFIMSGDADGHLWLWDWKTNKILKKIKCHESVLIGCEWHPHETSKVATCSWDGTIKYWD